MNVQATKYLITCESEERYLAAVLLKLPVSVVEGTDLTSLEPTGDAVEVKSVVTDTPSNSALFTGGGSLIGLALNAEVHNVVSANSTVVDNNIPCPESDRRPLLHLEAFLFLSIAGLSV